MAWGSGVGQQRARGESHRHVGQRAPQHPLLRPDVLRDVLEELFDFEGEVRSG